MGINTSAVKVFLIDNDRQPFTGDLLTLGKQDVFVTPEVMKRTFDQYDREVAVDQNVPVFSQKPGFVEGRFITDEYLFSALGFDRTESMDASDYESADHVLDLNQVETPPEYCDRWDTIFDGGTVEHIFNVPNALANLGRMVKVGGRIVHIAPSSNHIDHGFYMFSPTLFWDYYKANGYDVNVCQVFRYHASDPYDGKWAVSDYIPGGLTRVSMGGLDDGMYGVILIATKKEGSTYTKVPQQGLYSTIKWKGNEPDQDIPGLKKNFKGSGLGLSVLYRL